MENYYKNPRKITEDQKKLLKDSLLKFGDLSGIIHNIRTDQIIGGNKRSEIMDIIENDPEIIIIKKYREPTSTGTIAEGYVKYNNEHYNYRQVDWDEKKEEEANIKANKLGGDWDFKILKDEFDFDDLLTWGFNANEFPDFEDNTEIEQDENVPVLKDIENTKSRTGDIWTLGNHKVCCGSCTDVLKLEKLLGNALIDLYITDPPYNVNYEGKTKEKLKIDNDKMSDDDFRQFLIDSFNTVNTKLKEGASFYIWHADLQGYNFRGAISDVGWQMRQCLIWSKNTIVLGRQDYQWQHEPCIYGWKSGTHSWYSDRKQSTILHFDKPARNEHHPTMKPVNLFAYQIKNSSKAGDIVFDSFLGSGTTIIACEQLNRSCFGFEIDPKYCDVIIERYINFTGSDPVRDDGVKWSEL
jgi:site-specific DNA-methyltransferase (adenine-specific)